MMKAVCRTLFAGLVFALATGAHPAAACDPGIIHVAPLQNRAVDQFDKFWGAPGAFGNTAAGILAMELMTRTGAAVNLLSPDNDSPGLLSGDTPQADAAEQLLDGMPGCFLAAGAVDSALVYAKNSFKFKPGFSVGVGTNHNDDKDKDWYDYLGENLNLGQVRRKFRVETTARLVLYDRRSGAFMVQRSVTGEHETSVTDYGALDKDKKFVFSEDPAQASGSPLGIAFVRMFADFADAAAGTFDASTASTHQD